MFCWLYFIQAFL